MSEDGPNPYAPPQTVPASPVRPPWSHEQVRQRLMVPALGILASVVINVACLAWMMTVTVWVVIRTDPVPAVSFFHTVIWTVVAVLVTGFVNYSAAAGAVAMLQLSDYRAAIRGAWFAMVPCGLGCVVAFPFAIWADCLLRDPRVPAVFSGEKLRFLWRGRS